MSPPELVKHMCQEPGRTSVLHVGALAGCSNSYCREAVAEGPKPAIPRSLGVGPDAPTVTNERGASQSAVPYAFTSIDPHALMLLAQVHAQGDAKYGRDNWRGISVDDHLNHALTHIVAYLVGDDTDDHLAHAMCRVEMAIAVEFQGGPDDPPVRGATNAP